MGIPATDRREPAGGGEQRSFLTERAGRIDAVVAARYPDLSRARVQRLIDRGLITCDGEPCRKSTMVEPGAAITVDFPPPRVIDVLEAAALPVLYEDELVVVIDKPAGLAVHGAPGDAGPLVVSWFVATYPDDAAHFDAERPGIVHRLDKETSGVLVLARTPAAQAKLSEAFAARDVHKTYVAVCAGTAQHQKATVEAPIGRDPRDRTRMAVTRGGRAARTEYEVIASDGERSLVVVRPETGRTHQIRVHLAAVGLPVVGDAVYGDAEERGRHLLHAAAIDVPHPAGGRLTVSAPLPADMRAVLPAPDAGDATRPYLAPPVARLDKDAS